MNKRLNKESEKEKEKGKVRVRIERKDYKREMRKDIMGLKKRLIKLLGGIPRDEIEKVKKQLEKKSESSNKNSLHGDFGGFLETVERERLEQGKEKVRDPESERTATIPIYEKLAKIEEILRIIDERLLLMDNKVATREDTKEISKTLQKTDQSSQRVLLLLDTISKQIDELKDSKGKLTRQLNEATRQATRLMDEKRDIDKRINLLEAHKRIIQILRSGEMSTIDLSQRLGYSRQYLWERLSELKEANIVEAKKVGRKTLYKLRGTYESAPSTPDNTSDMSGDVSADMSTDTSDAADDMSF